MACDACILFKQQVLAACTIVQFCLSFVDRHFDVKPRLSKFRAASVGPVNLEDGFSASVQC